MNEYSMSPHFNPSIMLFRYTDESDRSHLDAAVIITLGKDATALAERLRDYVLSIPERELTRHHLDPLAVLPLTPTGIGEIDRFVPTIVAISGQLSSEEIAFAARLMERGGHCTVMVDAETEIRPEWRSVVRLPPGLSRDEQWLSGMQAYLEALFNFGLIGFDAYMVHECTRSRLCQFSLVHVPAKNKLITSAEAAVQDLARRCDLAACDTFLLLVHWSSWVRMKRIHWIVQACRNALAEIRDDEYQFVIADLPSDSGFAISLMAGTPRPIQLPAPHPDHLIVW
jgi:hypothetical protein